MKIYCGKNRKGVWKASLDKNKVSKFDEVFESEVETIHNGKAYMIKTYCGFDYGYSSGTIHDVISHVPQLFHSVSAAKKSDIWRTREGLVKENPSKYHVTPFSIATDDFGHPFVYGDAMSGNFNMEIFTVKVI